MASETRQKIDIGEHPSALCPVAKLVWADRYSQRCVYSVAGGYVACPGGLRAYEGLFASEAEARAYLEESNAAA